MKWAHPPVIKIYEALGSVADGRIQLSGNSAKVYSSNGNKFYTVNFDPASKSIMTNDNGSFYKGYLGYPAIAFLMLIGELNYSPSVAEKLKGIAWKDINQKFKNDFEKTRLYILEGKAIEDRAAIEREVSAIDEQLKTKSYDFLGPRIQPPEGY
ncbi:MAG TPA: hypothetical protein VMU27_00565 [Candidatus Paceibacterota bacterium]|nr:hypothetical protein [Candidatus Paceibacterota bacterium]